MSVDNEKSQAKFSESKVDIKEMFSEKTDTESKTQELSVFSTSILSI